MKPSSSLAIEIETADGTLYRRDGDGLSAEDRPLDISWRTQRGDGFADGSVRFRRSVLRDWPDLNLGDTVRTILADGSVGYEGYVTGLPKETGDGQSVTVALAGWMSHARDKRFREIYVDRDVSRWTTAPSMNRQLALIAGAYKYKLSAGQVTSTPDPSGKPSVLLSFSRIAKSGFNLPLAETWYDPAGLPIGSVTFDYSDKDGTNTALVAANWSVLGFLSDDDVLSNVDRTSNRTETASVNTLTATGNRYYAGFQASYVGADIAADGDWKAWFANPTAIGTHGLTVANRGITASSVITNIANRFCPLLDTSGVQETTYPISHVAYVEPTYPHDAFLELNRAHLWELDVWEDRVLYFQPPAGLDDYDWQVRTDDPGVKLSFGGDTLTDLANGVEVRFTDLLTGKAQTITPDNYAALADADPDNPLNRQGRQRWLSFDLPFPALESDAVQYGRAFLAEAIRAKSPTTISCGFHIRDRAGNWQPTAKVRSGQRIAITDHPNDAPRRIIDTSYSHDGRGLTISADRASQRLSAIVDRISLARTTAGL